MGKHEPRAVLQRWPVILALAAVTVLIVAMIGLDLHFSQKEALTTSEIIENTQRSIVLLKDIRWEAKRLVTARTVEEAARRRRAMLEDEARYEPIASYPGERKKWERLKGLLARLPEAPVRDDDSILALEDSMDTAIDELVALNNQEGQGHFAAIRAAHVQAIWSDVVVGGVVLCIVALISGWLLRVLSRQRRMILKEVRLLDEKNAELEAFAGRAAHDLRGPMNPIRGYADLILEVPALPDKAAGMARKIRRAVDRMAKVVDDMLALSISGRPPEGCSSSALVVPHVIEEMGAELQDVALSTKLDGGQVGCPEGVLSQILRNLVGNAIKFRSRARPLRVAIETRDVDSMVELSVEDNGVGMDPESAKHVFEPFYRGLTDHEVPGHGLGLAIVERTVRALGGRCELSSVLDRYTRITIRLPRA